MGYIPKTTKQKIKLFHGMSAQRVLIGMFVLTVAFGVCSALTTNVLMQLLITAIILALYLILSGRSPSNPKKIFLFGLIDYLMYIVSPKKMYGVNTEEYKSYKESEAKKNVQKGRKAKKD